MSNEGWGQQPAPIGHNQPPADEVTVVVEPSTLPKFEVKYESQPETEEPEAFRLRRNAEIQFWQTAKQNFESAQQQERDHRAKVTATLFPKPKKGTQRYELGGGYKVKLVYGLTYTLGDKEKLTDEGLPYPIKKQIEDLEEAIIAKYPVEGPIILDNLITWTPNLSGSQYEKLDQTDPVKADIAAMISEYLTIKPSSPQLTFEEPKGE